MVSNYLEISLAQASFKEIKLPSSFEIELCVLNGSRHIPDFDVNCGLYLDWTEGTSELRSNIWAGGDDYWSQTATQKEETIGQAEFTPRASTTAFNYCKLTV